MGDTKTRSDRKAVASRLDRASAAAQATATDCHGNQSWWVAMDVSKSSPPEADGALGMDDYDERGVETLQELEALVRMRTELNWTEWKAHPRFKKDRMIREAQRRFGVGPAARPVGAVAPANDVQDARLTDAQIPRDAEFAAVCDARRDAWIEALDNESVAADSPRRAGGTDDE